MNDTTVDIPEELDSELRSLRARLGDLVRLAGQETATIDLLDRLCSLLNRLESSATELEEREAALEEQQSKLGAMLVRMQTILGDIDHRIAG